jgi:hypothetical protein
MEVLDSTISYQMHQLGAFRGTPRGFPCLLSDYSLHPENRTTVNSVVYERLVKKFPPVLHFDFDQHGFFFAGDAIWEQLWPQVGRRIAKTTKLSIFLCRHTVDTAIRAIDALCACMRANYPVVKVVRTIEFVSIAIMAASKEETKMQISLVVYDSVEQKLQISDVATEAVAWWRGELLMSETAKYAAETGVALLNLRARRPGFEERLCQSVLKHNIGIGFPQLKSLPVRSEVYFNYMQVRTRPNRPDQISSITPQRLPQMVPMALQCKRPSLDSLTDVLFTALRFANIDHWWVRYALKQSQLYPCAAVVSGYLDSASNLMVEPSYGNLKQILGQALTLRYLATYNSSDPYRSVEILESLSTERYTELTRTVFALKAIEPPAIVAPADWFGTNFSSCMFT